MNATIVIPQRGQSRLTLQCVHSFRTHHGDFTRIVVVDDGSPVDERRAIANCDCKNLELIVRSAEGVTAAWNAGARDARSEFLVFLNNDTMTSAPWLPRLLSPLATDAAVVCGVAARIENAVSESVLQRLPTRRFAEGWCFAVRRLDFEAMGGFDPSLRTYFSDTDLQARLLDSADSTDRCIAIVGCEGIAHLGHVTARRDPQRRARWQADRLRFAAIWRRRTRFAA